MGYPSEGSSLLRVSEHVDLWAFLDLVVKGPNWLTKDVCSRRSSSSLTLLEVAVQVIFS